MYGGGFRVKVPHGMRRTVLPPADQNTCRVDFNGEKLLGCLQCRHHDIIIGKTLHLSSNCSLNPTHNVTKSLLFHCGGKGGTHLRDL